MKPEYKCDGLKSKTRKFLSVQEKSERWVERRRTYVFVELGHKAWTMNDCLSAYIAGYNARKREEGKR